MKNIFEELFQYGFHDTDISSIYCEGLEIRLNFNDGIYLLDEKGKETCLSRPKQVVFKINSNYESCKNAFTIKEYGEKVKYHEYSFLSKHFQKDTFGISMVYYTNWGNVILFDGGFSRSLVLLSIEGIEEIIIQEL